MDRTELKKRLEPFRTKCAEKAKPLMDICLKEAYEGDSSTSFIVQVKVQWIESMSYSDAIEFLFDVLWETTTVETREKVFAIQILGSKDILHCSPEQIEDEV